jgi:hypothetical protein
MKQNIVEMVPFALKLDLAHHAKSQNRHTK